MGGYELCRQYLLAFYKVAYIRPCKAVLAGVAVAALLDRREVVLKGGVSQHFFAASRERKAVPCYTGLEYAVEHVYAAYSALHQTVGAAHAHKVAGLVCGHIGHHLLQHIVHHFLGLAH